MNFLVAALLAQVIVVTPSGGQGTLTRDRTGAVVRWIKTSGAIEKGLPRGATTLFFGACRLRAEASPLYLHLSAAPPVKGVQKYRLDFYCRTPRLVWHKWRSILGVDKQGLAGGAEVELFWLDKARRTPVFLISIVHNGFYGGSYSHHLWVFNRGLYRAPVMQTFDSYGDHNVGYWPRFNSRDTQGNLQVVIEKNVNGDPRGVFREKPLRWNNHRFQ